MRNNLTLFHSDAKNSEEDIFGRSQLQVWFEVSLGILMCLVALTGNILVVIAIHYDQRLNTITNILVENLAFTDIFMAALHMPFWIISLRNGRWIFGDAGYSVTLFASLWD